MTNWIVQLHDDRQDQVTADELTTRSSGDVWFLRSATPPPDKLSVVLVLAARQWHAIYSEDTAIVWVDAPEPKPAPLAL